MNITANSINVRHVLTMNMLNTFEMSHDVMLDLLLLIQCISIFMTNNTFRFETCMKKTSLIFNLVEITVRSKERNIQSISSRCCSLRWLFKLTIIDLLSSSECKSVLSAELTWWIPNLTNQEIFSLIEVYFTLIRCHMQGMWNKMLQELVVNISFQSKIFFLFIFADIYNVSDH